MTTNKNAISELNKLAEDKGLYLYQPMAMLDGHKYYLRKMVDGRRTLATVFSSDELQEVARFLTGSVLSSLACHEEAKGGPCSEIVLGEMRPCVLGT